MPPRHKRQVILPIHSGGATRTRRGDVMSSIHLPLLHPWDCSLYGSCLTPARPHASDCSRLIVAVPPVHGVVPCVEHCGKAVLPAFDITTFFISSLAFNVFKVMASWCFLPAELQSSFKPGHFCLLGLLEGCTVIIDVIGARDVQPS